MSQSIRGEGEGPGRDPHHLATVPKLSCSRGGGGACSGGGTHSLEEWLHPLGLPRDSYRALQKEGKASNLMDEEKEAAAGPMCSQSLYSMLHN